MQCRLVDCYIEVFRGKQLPRQICFCKSGNRNIHPCLLIFFPVQNKNCSLFSLNRRGLLTDHFKQKKKNYYLTSDNRMLVFPYILPEKLRDMYIRDL